MPRLLFFIVCEKALISQEDNDLTLIGVLDGLVLGSPYPPDTAEKVSFPHTWYAVARWKKESGDEEKSYEQLVQIIPPSGEPAGKSVAQIAFPQLPGVTNITRGEVFPFDGAGTYLFRLSYREIIDDEDEIEWQTAAEFPFELSIRYSVE